MAGKEAFTALGLERSGGRGDLRRERAHLGVDAGGVRTGAAVTPGDDADLDPGVVVVPAEHRATGVALAGVDPAGGEVARADLGARDEVGVAAALGAAGAVRDERDGRLEQVPLLAAALGRRTPAGHGERAGVVG